MSTPCCVSPDPLSPAGARLTAPVCTARAPASPTPSAPPRATTTSAGARTVWTPVSCSQGGVESHRVTAPGMYPLNVYPENAQIYGLVDGDKCCR